MPTTAEELYDDLPDITPPEPLDCGPYARWVAEQIVAPGAIERWRQRCNEAYEESCLRNAAWREWQGRRHGFLSIAANRKPAASRQPPKGGWVRERMWIGATQEQDTLVEVWVPPELTAGREPYAGGVLPFSACHTLSLADCYLVLALVHDATCRTGRINPFGRDGKRRQHESPALGSKSPDDDPDVIFYRLQMSHVAGLRADLDDTTVARCRSRVMADLDPRDLPADANGNAPPTPHPDGPEGGRWVWLNGIRHDVPKGNVYRMIDYMWLREFAGYDDLFGTVFDEAVEPQSIRSCVGKVKKVLGADRSALVDHDRFEYKSSFQISTEIGLLRIPKEGFTRQLHSDYRLNNALQSDPQRHFGGQGNGRFPD